jgi:hypothetical protein
LGVGGFSSSGWWLFLGGGGAGVELAELVPLLGLPAGGSFLWPSPRSRPLLLLLLLFSFGGVRRCPFIIPWPFCMVTISLNFNNKKIYLSIG